MHERILLKSNDLDVDVENDVQFHDIRTYVANPPERDLYVQKSSFNINLQYSSDFGGFEAVPNALSCVEPPGTTLELTSSRGDGYSYSWF